ncbi:hypothetical protein SAY87_015216 [Trapa incisa]|uniref:Uncharacterized protein n=1 Tax=Trapa incisa TaxID=236973 RepID=A0AAN7JLR8_9MYRT|nr:hypothetical protein SAY87_015216 [Trapa incisa]
MQWTVRLRETPAFSRRGDGKELMGGGQLKVVVSGSEPELDAEKLGVAFDLRDFVKGFTTRTFQSFSIQEDGSHVSGVPPTTSKVRQDLNEWQAKHATLVLSTVKENKIEEQTPLLKKKLTERWRNQLIAEGLVEIN